MSTASTIPQPPALAALEAEWAAFLAAQGLPDVDALEMAMAVPLSRENLAWVCDFIARWTAVVDSDRAAL